MTSHTGAALWDELKRLSVPVLAAINQRDWDMTAPEAREALAHVAPDFYVKWDSHEEPVSLRQMMEFMRQRVTQFPNYYMRIIQITCEVSENTGKASVYLVLEIQGTYNVTTQAISVFEWARDSAGKWWCKRSSGFRGTSLNSGFV